MQINNTPLLSEAVLSARVRALAAQLDAAYAGKTPLVLAVLVGAVVFAVDLTRHMKTGIHLDFVRASSYLGTTRATPVAVAGVNPALVKNRDILLVEDIVDTGHTASALLDTLHDHEPASIALCTLLDKPARRIVPVTVDYVGFSIEDVFVVGYGLDYNEQYRNLPQVHVLDSGTCPGQAP